MHEDDAECRLATRCRLHRRGSGLGILRDVGVELLQIIDRLVFAHDLHERGKRRIGCARRVGIGDLDFALQFRCQQIGPALRLLVTLGFEDFGVVTPAQRAGINADGSVTGAFRLFDSPVLQLIQHRRLVFERQVFGGRLHVRIAGAGPPDIGLRVAGFRTHLGISFAGRQANHIDLDVMRLFEIALHLFADDDIGRAYQVKLARRLHRCGAECRTGKKQCGKYRQSHGYPPVACV